MRKFYFFVLSLVLVIGFVSATPIHYSLTNQTQFNALSSNPLSAKYGQVRGVKVVYDLRTRKLHYVDGKEYKYHYQYCNKKLRFTEDLQVFNQQNYSNNQKRRFVLGNINYFESLDKYILEFSPVDVVNAKLISTLYNSITSTSFIKNSLLLNINSSHLKSIKNELRSNIKTIDPSEIYENQTFQAISKYKGVGTLRFIENLSESINDIEPTDIIILNETPLYLPQVTGIICTQFQTPLSHISILGQNRKLPVCAYKNAFIDEHIKSLIGQNVQLSVQSDTFFLAKSLNEPTLLTPSSKINLKYNLKVDSLVDIKNMTLKSKFFAGNKAANFASLYQLSLKHDFKTPEHAFAIPFHFYHEHIKTNGIYTDIEVLLTKNDILKDHERLKVELNKIQKKIKQVNISNSLLQAVNDKLSKQSEYTRFRFRSSTNAEDAVGFSGAGLYTSKTGIIGDEKKSIEKAIKSVWASMWSYEAFTERMFYNIDHMDAFMGILVHRAFPNEDVNGVAITKNIYRPDSYGYVINAQIGNENVVNPSPDVTCDQFICYPELKMKIYQGKNSIDVITTSSLNKGNLVMTNDEIKHLANQLRKIKSHYFRTSSTTKAFVEYGLDIEFKLDGPNRQLYIKQARYYND